MYSRIQSAVTFDWSRTITKVVTGQDWTRANNDSSMTVKNRHNDKGKSQRQWPPILSPASIQARSKRIKPEAPKRETQKVQLSLVRDNKRSEVISHPTYSDERLKWVSKRGTKRESKQTADPVEATRKSLQIAKLQRWRDKRMKGPINQNSKHTDKRINKKRYNSSSVNRIVKRKSDGREIIVSYKWSNEQKGNKASFNKSAIHLKIPVQIESQPAHSDSLVWVTSLFGGGQGERPPGLPPCCKTVTGRCSYLGTWSTKV